MSNHLFGIGSRNYYSYRPPPPVPPPIKTLISTVKKSQRQYSNSLNNVYGKINNLNDNVSNVNSNVNGVGTNVNTIGTNVTDITTNFDDLIAILDITDFPTSGSSAVPNISSLSDFSQSDQRTNAEPNAATTKLTQVQLKNKFITFIDNLFTARESISLGKFSLVIEDKLKEIIDEKISNLKKCLLELHEDKYENKHHCHSRHHPRHHHHHPHHHDKNNSESNSENNSIMEELENVMEVVENIVGEITENESDPTTTTTTGPNEPNTMICENKLNSIITKLDHVKSDNKNIHAIINELVKLIEEHHSILYKLNKKLNKTTPEAEIKKSKKPEKSEKPKKSNK